MKQWMHKVHDDCLDTGVFATSKKHDMSIEDVKSTTMTHIGWAKGWAEFLNDTDIKITMRNLDSIAKKSGELNVSLYRNKEKYNNIDKIIPICISIRNSSFINTFAIFK